MQVLHEVPPGTHVLVVKTMATASRLTKSILILAHFPRKLRLTIIMKGIKLATRSVNLGRAGVRTIFVSSPSASGFLAE